MVKPLRLDEPEPKAHTILIRRVLYNIPAKTFGQGRANYADKRNQAPAVLELATTENNYRGGPPHHGRPQRSLTAFM